MLAVAKCARLLQAAKRPVLVVGSQATLPPCGIEVIAQAVQVLVHRLVYLGLDLTAFPDPFSISYAATARAVLVRRDGARSARRQPERARQYTVHTQPEERSARS